VDRVAHAGLVGHALHVGQARHVGHVGRVGQVGCVSYTLTVRAGAVRAAVIAAVMSAAIPHMRAAAQASQPPAEATRPSFSEFLDGIRTEALARGIDPALVDSALADIEEPLSVVIERDRTQAEIVLPLETYISRRLTAKVLAMGRERYAEHRAGLAEIGAAYGVDPRIIAAIWGMESSFGRFSGLRPTIAALATLAWDPRRSKFFRAELFDALEIVNRGDIDLPHLRGSWAGAMGQVQFMPSSYLDYAEDYDGDGRRDIWNTPADVFASIANYLLGHGWRSGEPWGREVKLSRDAARRVTNEVARRAGSCSATRDMSVPLPAAEWRKRGVRLSNGRPLPPSTPDAALVSGATRHFLVFSNYDALLGYNCAHSYALSVGLLADRLEGAAPKSSAQPGRGRSKPRKRA
jgi:membrane-bound lytic murein transglycosylase B